MSSIMYTGDYQLQYELCGYQQTRDNALNAEANWPLTQSGETLYSLGLIISPSAIVGITIISPLHAIGSHSNDLEMSPTQSAS